MKEIVTCQEMKALDRNTIEKMKVPSCVLMERAALKTVEEMEKFLQRERKRRGFSVSAEAETTEAMERLWQGFFFSMAFRRKFIWREVRSI